MTLRQQLQLLLVNQGYETFWNIESFLFEKN